MANPDRRPKRNSRQRSVKIRWNTWYARSRNSDTTGLVDQVAVLVSGGSIPACAGEPYAHSRETASIAGLSPRVRGSRHVQERTRGAVGSIPRVRGSRASWVRVGCDTGSIPACAGEPCRPSSEQRPQRVYPRVCGGASALTAPANSIWGLSPRVRGSLHRVIGGAQVAGSIPACAGEPTTNDDQDVLHGVYPRVCGGAEGEAVMMSIWKGLSPRVRGSRAYALLGPITTGSIPACAGEPLTAIGARSCSRVYPRVCGGATFGLSDFTPTDGLSPRVRGSHGIDASADGNDGSIPACAGEPSTP